MSHPYRIAGWMSEDGTINWTWRYKKGACGVVEVRWCGCWETLTGKIVAVYEDENGKPYTR